MRPLYLFVLLTFMGYNSFGQCIDSGLVRFGGDYNFYRYIFGCPTYTFAANGDTSKKWNVLNDAIDIRQAPAKALLYKEHVENAIIKYAGTNFFSNIKFIDVEVVFPDNVKAFEGRSDVTKKQCLAKYFYHYQFKPDSIASYLIGVAVDANGRVISKFNFPSKQNYKPINKNFSYCRLIEIARRIQKNIDPIQEITFDYNKKTKRFYWLLSRGIVTNESHEGINYIKQVIVDAANLSIAKPVTGEALIVY